MPIFFRLHRAALKQSATDPLSGLIDINILTTGISESERERNAQLKNNLKKIIDAKRQQKVATVNYQTLFNEFKATETRVSKHLSY